MEIPIKNSKGSGSYSSILKSTSLIGSASVLHILISMVRIKFVAILLGPTGVGLIGLYTQITALASTATGMGIGNSGVRQVAEAVGTGDDEQIARTVITLRRMAWLTGAFGVLVLALFSVPISRITFKTDDYSVPIACLGVSLLFAAITVGQSCVLRGTRRISEVAKTTVFGALYGTLVSVPCFYVWGLQGVVPSLIFSAFAALAASWWYARRVPIAPIDMSWLESFQEARTLLSLGLSFMGAGLVGSLTIYIIQVVLIRQFSLAGFGIYQAAFSLSGVLVGFVLGAMGADYYPRLTAVAGVNASIHRMVNEQSQISILLALPCLAAMMVFSPLVIQLFYAESFSSAVPVLRWCVLGMLGRVFSWPLGFVLLAKGNGKLYFATEALACGFHFVAVFVFIQMWGLEGAGIAFITLYVAYTALMLYIVRRQVGRAWTISTFQMSLAATTLMGLLMLNCTLTTQPYVAWAISCTTLVLVTVFCFRRLSQKSGITVNDLFCKLRSKQN